MKLRDTVSMVVLLGINHQPATQAHLHSGYYAISAGQLYLNAISISPLNFTHYVIIQTPFLATIEYLTENGGYTKAFHSTQRCDEEPNTTVARNHVVTAKLPGCHVLELDKI